FNIPNPDGTFDQHVMNTGNVNLPWCRFVNMNAICFGLFENNLYFGDALGNVCCPIAAIGPVSSRLPLSASQTLPSASPKYRLFSNSPKQMAFMLTKRHHGRLTLPVFITC